MQKHTLLVPLVGSTLSASILDEVRDLFPADETRITLLQEQLQPYKQAGFKKRTKNYEALRLGGYKAVLRLAQGRLSDEVVRTVAGEHVDVLAILTQNLDANLASVNALMEDVLERVSVPVLFLQADAQDLVLTTLHPAKEHCPSDYAALAISTA